MDATADSKQRWSKPLLSETIAIEKRLGKPGNESSSRNPGHGPPDRFDGVKLGGPTRPSKPNSRSFQYHQHRLDVPESLPVNDFVQKRR